MEFKMNVKVKKFSTPNFILPEAAPRQRQDGLSFGDGIPLREADPQLLSDLCDAFRVEVFKKAGTNDPRINEHLNP